MYIWLKLLVITKFETYGIKNKDKLPIIIYLFTYIDFCKKTNQNKEKIS